MTGTAGKLDLICEQPVPVVSLTFGCPAPSEMNRLQSSGSAVWVTVTTVGEAQAAQRAGADALVVQGVDAGGHRGQPSIMHRSGSIRELMVRPVPATRAQ
jgi:nitronate monooxygenase